MSLHEVQVFILFLLLILLWFFKTPLFMPGWGDLFMVSGSLARDWNQARAGDKLEPESTYKAEAKLARTGAKLELE